MHVVQDGDPQAPVLLLIHGTGASAAWWEPVLPGLTAAHRVVRVDLLGHGGSTEPSNGYDIPAQARRVGAVLDDLGVRGPVVVVGHSTGGSVATALAERRPETVAALALVNSGPSPQAVIPQGALSRLFTTPLSGRPLWRLFSGAIVRKALSNAVTRPVPIPEALVEDARGMSYRAVTATGDEALAYLVEGPLPVRLAVLGVPLLVVFGAEDHRWHSASADEYRAVPGARVEMLPGVGHTPMLEDPERTVALLLDFAAAHATGSR
jgi:pimeloyl-ACP methyl ester carboxylesterase